MKHIKSLSLLFLFWVIGDLLTTWYGFTIGIQESNPLLIGKNILHIAFLKLLGFLVIVYLSQSITSKKTWRTGYTVIMTLSVATVLINSFVIYTRVFW